MVPDSAVSSSYLYGDNPDRGHWRYILALCCTTLHPRNFQRLYYLPRPDIFRYRCWCCTDEPVHPGRNIFFTLSQPTDPYQGNLNVTDFGRGIRRGRYIYRRHRATDRTG